MWWSALESLRDGIGVRLRLSLLAMAAIVPLFGLLVGGLVIDRHLAIGTARTHAIDLARLIAERQADSVQQAKELLSVLRIVPEIVENSENCHAILKAVAADQPQFNTIGIVRSDGVLICNSIVEAKRKFSDPGFAREVMNSDPQSFSISKFRIGALTGKPTVFVAAPLRPEANGSASPGMVFVSLNLQQFTTVAQQFVGSEDWSVIVVETRTDTILAQTAGHSFSVGKSFPDHPLMRAMARQPDGGCVETDDFDGVKRIYGFAPLPSSEEARLVVGVGLARSLVLADANRRMMIGLTLALVAAVCAACGAWFLGDLWQLRPIRALVAAARELGKGDLTTRVEIASWQAPEFRALGGTLNEMARDIANFQKLLVEREAQLRLLAENATDLVFQLDLDFVRRYLSPACFEILGFSPEELLGTTPLDMIHPDDRAEAKRVFQSLIQGDMERSSLVYRIGHRDGHWVWVHSELRLLRDPQTKRPIGILGALRDISGLKAAEEAVRQSEARYRLLADNVVDLIICLNLDLKPTYVSPASHQLLGCDPGEVAAATLEDFALPEDRAFLDTALRFLQDKGELVDFRFRIRHRSDMVRWLEMSGRKPAGGDSIVLVLHDITTRQQAEEQLEEANNQLRDLAAHDFLTGLANRRALEDLLGKEFRRAQRNASSLALIMIDVDRFKAYNDLYGHPGGDTCLRKMAEAVRRALQRPSDLAARYGGEEIAILLPDTDEIGARSVAERIRSIVLELKIEHRGGVDHIATVSAGVAAIVPKDGQTWADLLDAADQALYAAKASGRNRVACASHLGAVTLLPPRRRSDRVKLG
jgi:diguanylate cyclase (GGDEF)-like protein/PAS domain S-box-containing protein